MVEFHGRGGKMTDLIIGFDYQNIVKQFRNLRKARDFLVAVNTGPINAGWITYNYRHSPLDGRIEQGYITLEGEGPFYSLDNRMLRYISRIHPGFKFPEVGDIIWLGGFRLKVIDNHRGSPCEFIVMLPDILSILIYAILPFARWFDLIYRRLILKRI
jgi:hypothetical protein